jgi:hypothetical protein
MLSVALNGSTRTMPPLGTRTLSHVHGALEPIQCPDVHIEEHCVVVCAPIVGVDTLKPL